jgi:hypothetical protein
MLTLGKPIINSKLGAKVKRTRLGQAAFTSPFISNHVNAKSGARKQIPSARTLLWQVSRS